MRTPSRPCSRKPVALPAACSRRPTGSAIARACRSSTRPCRCQPSSPTPMPGSAKAAGRASPRIPTSAARACRRRSRSPATRCGPRANVAFALCPELSQGAILALDRHGSDELKAQLPRASSSPGEWTGTMCLTEPQAGSDLAALTTRAEPQADGSYLLTGRKIYITWGDHPMTDEHRAPGARAAARARRRAPRASRCSWCRSTS